MNLTAEIQKHGTAGPGVRVDIALPDGSLAVVRYEHYKPGYLRAHYTVIDDRGFMTEAGIQEIE